MQKFGLLPSFLHWIDTSVKFNKPRTNWFKTLSLLCFKFISLVGHWCVFVRKRELGAGVNRKRDREHTHHYEGEGTLSQAQPNWWPEILLWHDISFLEDVWIQIRSLKMVHISWLLNSSSKNLFYISLHEIMWRFTYKDKHWCEFLKW